jgi:Ca2+-binding RTX toxin-like protein
MLAEGAFQLGTAAADADDRIIYDSATGKLFYDADGNAAGAQVLFAQVTAGTALTDVDFVAFG